MSILSKNDIEKLCKEKKMIEPYNPKKLKYASYDLSVGDEYRLSSENKVIKISKNGFAEIPPHEICFILTEEKLSLPNDICALIFSRIRGAKDGFLMHPQPPIEPGSKGKLYVLLHNLSNNTIKLKRGQHLATIVFLRLFSPLKNGYGSDEKEDKYMGKEHLEEIIGTNVYTPALKDVVNEVKNTVNNWREKFLSNWMPGVLVIITILLMILTILLMLKIDD